MLLGGFWGWGGPFRWIGWVVVGVLWVVVGCGDGEWGTMKVIKRRERGRKSDKRGGGGEGREINKKNE